MVTKNLFFLLSIFCVSMFSLQGMEGAEAEPPALHRAIKEGDVQRTTELLAQGADPFESGEYGVTALHTAAETNKNSLELTKLILDKMDPDERKALVNIPDDSEWTPLHFAIVNNNPETVKFLVEKGADLTAKNAADETVFHLAGRAENIPSSVIKLMINKISDPATKKALINTQDNVTGDTPLNVVVKYAEFAARDLPYFAQSLAYAQLLLEHGADPNIPDVEKRTPLRAAVKSEMPAMVNLLLKFGADPNIPDEDGNTLLHHLTQTTQNLEIVQAFLNKKANPTLPNKKGITPLHNAVRSKNPALIKLLLRFTKDPNVKDKGGNTPLHYIAATKKFTNDEREIINVLLEKRVQLSENLERQTPLHVAARANATEKVAMLVDFMKRTAKLAPGRLALINFPDLVGLKDFAPLHYAAAYINPEMIQALLEAGADVNRKTADGSTALHLLIRGPGDYAEDEYDVSKGINILLDSGAQFIADQRGETPLHKAAHYGYTDMMQKFIDAGADINTQDASGNTPLHTAVNNGHPHVVRLFLMQPNINLTLRNNAGQTALETAQAQGLADIIALFKKFQEREIVPPMMEK